MSTEMLKRWNWKKKSIKQNFFEQAHSQYILIMKIGLIVIESSLSFQKEQFRCRILKRWMTNRILCIEHNKKNKTSFYIPSQYFNTLMHVYYTRNIRNDRNACYNKNWLNFHNIIKSAKNFISEHHFKFFQYSEKKL